MRIYWDSSSLIETLKDEQLKKRLFEKGGMTRSHTLCEIFSTLTGGRLGIKIDSSSAVNIISKIADVLDIVEIEDETLLYYLSMAKSKGVRGGRVYDYIHATVALENDCDNVYTNNPRDFEGLFDSLNIIVP